MNDEKTKENKDPEQPRGDDAGREDAAGILLVERPRRPGTLEIQGPPGMSVRVVEDQWSTKIVLTGFQGDEGRDVRHGHADDGT